MKCISPNTEQKDRRKKERDALALLQNRPIFDIDIKQMDLLVSVCNLSFLVNPKHCIFDTVCVKTWLVHANVDGKLLASRFLLQTTDKHALLDWFDQPDGLIA